MSATHPLLFTLLAAAIFAAKLNADPPATLHNSLGMSLVRIPAGEFLMGTPPPQTDAQKEDYNEAERQHTVRITRDFYIGKHEVTRGAFAKFVDTTGYKTTLERTGGTGFGYDPASKSIEILPRFNWREVGYPTRDDQPVFNIDWDDATAFCKWLTQKEGHTHRLPTEAEWEYVCRGGTKTQYSTGDDEDSLKGFANLSDASFIAKYPAATWSVAWNDGHAFAAPVGSFRPNAFGVYDMHGNVWEWCQDWYAADYFEHSPTDDPPGPATGTIHVLRGGAFTNRFRFLRSADRDATRPKYRQNFTGFRVVREMESQAR
jgi:sulfatase modifying factor 1